MFVGASLLRVLLGRKPLSVNSTHSLLGSGLPAFGTTTAHSLRVLANFFREQIILA
jgi:hypothetical protein